MAAVLSFWRRRKRWLLGLLSAGLLAALAAPPLLLVSAVADTRHCMYALEQRRGGPLPPCDVARGRLAWLSQLPTVARPATRAAEELRLRWALTSYLDAAIGQPDASRRGAQLKEISLARRLLVNGSHRQRLDELGPGLAAGTAGSWAQRIGDRTSLVAQGEQWTQHYVASAAYRAALIMGDNQRAQALAQHYTEHPNKEMRIRTAALLCLGDKRQRGVDLLVAIERGWAKKRDANYARNFGDVRVVIEACAMAPQVQAPPLPAYGYAGQWNEQARLLALRLRRVAASCPDGVLDVACLSSKPVRNAAEQTRTMLQDGTEKQHRLALLAAIMPTVADAGKFITLTRTPNGPRNTHVATVDSHATVVADAAGRPGVRVMLFDQIDAGRSPRPYVSAEQYVRAAVHATALMAEEPASASASASASPSPSSSSPSPSPSPSVRRLIDVWWLRAAVAFARAGDGPQALALANEWGMDTTMRALLRSTLYALVGDWQAAASSLRETPEGPALVKAQYLLQRAVVTLPAPAGVTDVEQALVLLDGAAEGVASLRRQAEWLQAAAEQSAAGPVKTVAAPASASLRPMVPFSLNVPLSPQQRRSYHQAELAQWIRWAAAPTDEKLTFRYRSWHRRAAPAEASAPFMWLAGRLVEQPEHAELWLDALTSHAFQTLSLRAYAFARALSARWRGDGAAYNKWWLRYRQLEIWAHHPRDAELYRALSL